MNSFELLDTLIEAPSEEAKLKILIREIHEARQLPDVSKLATEAELKAFQSETKKEFDSLDGKIYGIYWAILGQLIVILVAIGVLKS